MGYEYTQSNYRRGLMSLVILALLKQGICTDTSLCRKHPDAVAVG